MLRDRQLLNSLISVGLFTISCGYQKGSRDSYQVKPDTSDASAQNSTVSVHITRPQSARGQDPARERPMNAFFLKITPQDNCPDDHHTVIGWFPENSAGVEFAVSSECSFRAWLSFGHQSYTGSDGTTLTATVGNGLEDTYYKSQEPLHISRSALSQNTGINLIFRLELTEEGRSQGYTEEILFSSSSATKQEKNNTAPVTFDQVEALLTGPGKGDCARSGCHTDGSAVGRLQTLDDFKNASTKVIKRVSELKNMPPESSNLSENERRLIRSWLEGGALPSSSTVPRDQDTPDTGNNNEQNDDDSQQNDDDSQQNDDNSEQDLTTFADVESLLTDPGKGNCARAGCHATGGSLRPMSNFDELKEAGTGILTRVIQQKNMPPNAAELSDAERSLIEKWLQDGSLP